MTDPTRDSATEHPFFEAMREQFVARPLPDPPRRPLPIRNDRRPARRLLRPLPLAGAGMALAAVAVALVIALGADGTVPSPAYAVTVNHHTITISWRQWKAISALNARLTSLGMRIRVVPVVAGCVAPVHTVVYARGGVPTHIAAGPAKTIQVDDSHHVGGPGGGVLTTWNDTLPGRTRIFTATRSGGWDGGVFTVVGAAPRCVGDRG